MPSTLPDWRLPAGVTSALWEYAQADHIADDYDNYFAYNSLFQYDDSILSEAFQTPGVLVDLGCGTGRLLGTFAQRGFTTVGVDLSGHMLRVVGDKARNSGLTIHRVQANMVELGCFADASADYVICMFSSLGMIRGRENRQKVLAHVRRMLKPGGRFAIHVHNRWYNLFVPQGRTWLFTNLMKSMLGREEAGDKIFDYRGIPRMFLHTFSYGEMKRSLSRAGFTIERYIPLDTQRQRPLPRAWLWGRIRANGWIFLCR